MSHNHSFKHLSSLSIPTRLGLALALGLGMILSLLLLSVEPALADGDTYYVNAATGDDSHTAMEAQNPATLWKTIAHAEASPAYVWNVQDLAPNTGGVITITGVLSGEPLAAGIFTNTAEIACAETEDDETNNSSDAPLTVQNVAPVAAAGSDQTVSINATVTLDGSASSDANGDALTYGWAQTGGPSVTLSCTR